MLLLNIPSPPAGRLPEGWTVKVNHGTPQISTGSGPEGTFVELRSAKSSFSLDSACAHFRIRVRVGPGSVEPLDFRSAQCRRGLPARLRTPDSARQGHPPADQYAAYRDLRG